jgi:hypothetical protein
MFSNVPVYLEDINRPVLVPQLFFDLLKGVHFSAYRGFGFVHVALAGPQSPSMVEHILLRKASLLQG